MELRQRWKEIWRVAFTLTKRDRLESKQVQERWSEEWHLHLAIQTPIRAAQALLLLLLVTAGFGLKPLRFAITVILTVFTFSGSAAIPPRVRIMNAPVGWGQKRAAPAPLGLPNAFP